MPEFAPGEGHSQHRRVAAIKSYIKVDCLDTCAQQANIKSEFLSWCSPEQQNLLMGLGDLVTLKHFECTDSNQISSLSSWSQLGMLTHLSVEGTAFSNQSKS